MSSFIEKCLRSEVLLEDIDDFVDLWHKDSGNMALHDFLGMTQEEYSLWIADPSTLPFIVSMSKRMKNLETRI